MPILAREPDCFPDDLFDGRLDGLPAAGSDRPEAGRRWWLAYARSRREKDLARRLASLGVPVYCPTVGKRTRSPAGRVREAFLPLFPGYVFLFGSPDERQAALKTNCVSSISTVEDQTRLTRELGAIRRLLASDRPVLPEERIEPGAPVRVTSGPLRGQEGTLVERLGKRRLLIVVELLRRGASVEIDECDIEAI
jgi:transcriptional antiterminator RfaH